MVKKLETLKEGKASRPDGLSPRLSKELREEMYCLLTIIFHKPLHEGAVSEDWRAANVCHMYKKGGKSQASNYRPVRLMSQVCKVFNTILTL